MNDLHVSKYFFRLEPLVSLSDETILGHELLAGAESCPGYDLAGWRGFYQFLVKALPQILQDVEGLLFINVDGDQLLDTEIQACLEAFPASTGRIVLEWTEHSFHAENMVSILTALAKAKKQGFLIAVDDIGSGVDGMGRAIACTPVFGKIDGAMLHHARKSDPETGHNYIKGMVDSLRSHGIKVLIEWVETEKDLEIAQRTGAHFGQGYYWTTKTLP